MESSTFDRRDFLKRAGGGVLAATLSNQLTGQNDPIAAPGDMDDTKPIKLQVITAETEQKTGELFSPLRPEKRIGYAIVGLGHLALEQVLPAMLSCKYSKPVALVSGDLSKAQKVAHQYGIPQTNIYNYENFDTIKNNPEIDVVYIILPNSMHEEYTIRAAKAGKHVLCEKPMTVSSASAQRMIDACKVAGKKLMVAYRIQYESQNRQVMKWVREKKFGKVRVIDCFNGQNTVNLAHWRLKKAIAGGGSLPDIGLYNLNTARFLLGEEPETIIASTYSTLNDERFREVEETVMFQLIFPGGTVVNNTCSYGVHEYRHYHCHADNGGSVGMKNAFAYSGQQIEVSKAEDNLLYNSTLAFAPHSNQFTAEIDHLSSCILFNKSPYTPGEEGLQDHKLMEAIYESARTGKPVRMPHIDKPDAFRGDAPEA